MNHLSSLDFSCFVRFKVRKFSGRWQCFIEDENVCEVNVIGKEIRGLLEPFKVLHCKMGDRVCFLFNKIDHTICVKKVTIKVKSNEQ